MRRRAGATDIAVIAIFIVASPPFSLLTTLTPSFLLCPAVSSSLSSLSLSSASGDGLRDGLALSLNRSAAATASTLSLSPARSLGRRRAKEGGDLCTSSEARGRSLRLPSSLFVFVAPPPPRRPVPPCRTCPPLRGRGQIWRRRGRRRSSRCGDLRRRHRVVKCARSLSPAFLAPDLRRKMSTKAVTIVAEGESAGNDFRRAAVRSASVPKQVRMTTDLKKTRIVLD